MLVDGVSVARVRPRTSKGITDLLLPQTSTRCDPGSPSKKPTARADLTPRRAPAPKGGHG